MRLLDSEGAQFSPSSSSSSSFPFSFAAVGGESFFLFVLLLFSRIYAKGGRPPRRRRRRRKGALGEEEGVCHDSSSTSFFPFSKRRKRRRKILLPLISRSSEEEKGWVAKESRFMGREKEEGGQNLLHGILKTGDKLLLLKLSEIFRGKRKNPLLAGSKRKKYLFWLFSLRKSDRGWRKRDGGRRK